MRLTGSVNRAGCLLVLWFCLCVIKMLSKPILVFFFIYMLNRCLLGIVTITDSLCRSSDVCPPMQSWTIRFWGTTCHVLAWLPRILYRPVPNWRRYEVFWSNFLYTFSLKRTFSLLSTLKRESCLLSFGHRLFEPIMAVFSFDACRLMMLYVLSVACILL